MEVLGKLKEVRFVFEDCNTCIVPAEYIGRYALSNVRDVIVGASRNFNHARRANTIAMEIFPDSTDCRYIATLSVRRDIASVEFIDMSGYVETYLTRYRGTEINHNQKNYVASTGNLYIVISKTEGIADFWESRDVDNSIANAERKIAYGIGKRLERWHNLTEHSLPDTNRWVYLREEKGQAIEAKRVQDSRCGWKFVFKYPGKAIHFPKQWKYL